MIPMIHKLLFYTLQKIFSIPFFIIDLLSPTFYLKRLRAKIVEYKKSTSVHLAIFVVHQKNNLPFYIRNMLEALLANHMKVVVVVNGEATSDTKNYLELNCHTVIYRKNTGRDFGAYQDALSNEVIDDFQKVLLVNDSVFYFKKNLNALIGDTLKNKQDWIAFYDNYNLAYHAQSFFLCFGPAVLRSKAFKIFWRNYRPFNLRHRVIKEGELKLSHALMDAEFQCHVIMNASDLGRNLRALKETELLHLKDFLTVFFLKHHPGILGKEGRLFIQHLVFGCESYPPVSHGLYAIFGILNDVAVFKRDLALRQMTTVDEFQLLLEEMKLDPYEIKAALAEFSLDARSRPRSLFDKIKFRFDLV